MCIAAMGKNSCLVPESLWCVIQFSVCRLGLDYLVWEQQQPSKVRYLATS